MQRLLLIDSNNFLELYINVNLSRKFEAALWTFKIQASTATTSLMGSFSYPTRVHSTHTTYKKNVVTHGCHKKYLEHGSAALLLHNTLK